MTGEELMFLSQNISSQKEVELNPSSSEEKWYVYGLDGLARLFNCSKTTAWRIKKSKKIDAAVTEIGKKIIVDARMALALAGKKTGGRK